MKFTGEWEQVGPYHQRTDRMAVPDGWLVRTVAANEVTSFIGDQFRQHVSDDAVALVFVPDKGWHWKIEPQPAKETTSNASHG